MVVRDPRFARLGMALVAHALAALAMVSPIGVHAQEDPTLHAQPAASPEATELLGQELSALPPSKNLLDAWAIVERHASPPWAYSFVQEKDPDTQDRQRLAFDLEGLALRARLSGDNRLARGLAQWSQTLASLTHGRIPGRLTPTWLMNHPRAVPELGRLARLGWCEPPAWVEVWSAQGVARYPWQPGMTTHSLFQALPPWAYGSSDYAHVITPLGEVQRIGIAAWNHQSVSIIPGSRVVTQVPLTSTAADWLNTAVPRFLSSRLPGDDCMSFPLSSSAATDIHANRTAKH